MPCHQPRSAWAAGFRTCNVMSLSSRRLLLLFEAVHIDSCRAGQTQQRSLLPFLSRGVAPAASLNPWRTLCRPARMLLSMLAGCKAPATLSNLVYRQLFSPHDLENCSKFITPTPISAPSHVLLYSACWWCHNAGRTQFLGLCPPACSCSDDRQARYLSCVPLSLVFGP